MYKKRSGSVIAAITILLAGWMLWQSASPSILAASLQEKTGSDWPVYLGQPESDHYSALTQINRKNVAHLRKAWSFETGSKGMLETTPIMIGRTLYAATSAEEIIAIDGATGKLQWKFDPHIASMQPIRGVTYWSDKGKGRILAGVVNSLYELDAATGEPVSTFGHAGYVDLGENLGIDSKTAAVAMTSPGVVYKDTIIVGFRAPETHPAPRGDIRAYDLHTGALRWTFHTIPHTGEFGSDTWPKDAWQHAGAANNWAGMSLDPKRGIVYIPTGSAVDDFFGGDRAGDDLFADTLLALNAETGQRIWHFQDVHHDIWDRDLPAPPALLTVRRDGKNIDAVAQTTKQGYLFLFDRETGKPLFPIEEMKVAQSTVPGESSSPTQPHPLLPMPFARQRLTPDMLTQRTPEAHAWALNAFHTFKGGDIQFTPFSVDAQTIVLPGFDGGAEWGGPAVDPNTSILYVNANDVAYTGGLVKNGGEHGLGASIYFGQCSVCHGEMRKGAPPEFPSLLGITERMNDSQILQIVHGGKGRMPSFPNVSGDSLKALEAYIRTGKDEGPRVASTFVKSAALPGTPQAAAENPKGDDLFRRNCAICHGDTANGIQPGFPSLLGVGQRQSREQLAAVIAQGRGRMPAFHKLADQEITALLRYIGAPELSPIDNGTKKELEAIGTAEARYRFTGYRKFLDPDGYPAVAPPWGTLSAIDMNTGKYVWRIPFGEYPELAAKGMRNTGTENYGGPIVTAGGVLFIGATIFDRKFHAYDSATGKLLWETELPFGALATPATYMIDGKQFVVIAAGGGKDRHHPTGGMYIAFALP